MFVVSSSLMSSHRVMLAELTLIIAAKQCFAYSILVTLRHSNVRKES